MGRSLRYGWINVGLLTIISCIAFGFISNASSLYIGPVCSTLGIGRTDYGFITTAATLSGFVFVLLLGSMYRWFGQAKRLILMGLSAGVLYLFLFYMAPNVYFLYLAGLLRGVFSSFMGIGCVSLLISPWFEDNKAVAIGLIAAGSGLGGVILSPLVSNMIGWWGWRSASLVSGLVLLAAIVPIMLFLKERPEQASAADVATQPELPQAQASTEADSLPSGQRVRDVLQQPFFWMAMIGTVLFSVAMTMLVNNLADILDSLQLAAASIPYILSVLYLSNTLSKIAIGFLQKRLGALQTMQTCLFCFVLASLCITQAQQLPFALLFAVLLGISFAATASPFVSMVEQLFGQENYGMFLGFFLASGELGASVAPVISGLSIDRAGSYMPIIAASVLLSILAMLMLNRAFRAAPHQAGGADGTPERLPVEHEPAQVP